MEYRGMKRSRGVTLLELLVVIAIGSILMTVAIPAFQSVVSSQRSTTAVNELIESMILARSEAIKRGRFVSICASTNGTNCSTGDNWNRGWIVFSGISSASPATVDVGDEIIRVHQGLTTTLDITPTGNIDNFISFRPFGTTGTTAVNFSGTLTMCDENGNTGPRGLVISPSGRFQVSREVDHLGNSLDCS